MAAAAVAACNVEVNIDEPADGSYIYTLSAFAPDASTKTNYDTEGHFSWSAGDAISVLFHKDSENKFFTLSSATGNGVFSGTIDEGYTIGASDGTESDKKIWALFPASDNHSYTEGGNPSFYAQPEVDFSTSHFSANIPMYALNTDEGNLSFANLASTYKFILNGIKDGVSKVEFTVYNQETYGLSGSWPIHNEKYVNYGYADPASAKSTLKYIANVTNNTAVFYVSCRYYGKFQPAITIKNCATNRTIKTFIADKYLEPNYKNKVWPVTLDVSEAKGGDYYVPAISIDGNFDDWNDVPHTFTTTDPNIVEWKYTKDSQQLYFYYKVPKTKVVKAEGSYDYDPYFFVGLDTDNKSNTGATASGDLGDGFEAQLLIYPWRGDASVDPTCVIGEESNGNIKYPISTTLSEKLNVGGEIVGDFCYVEVAVPLASIGSPSGPIRVRHGFGWNPIEAKQIMPEVATVSAEDKTVGIGKTVAIGAVTNSSATITYTSNNTSVATVDANGVITGVAAGETTITVDVAAVAGEFTSASTTINVSVPAIIIDGDFSDWSSVSELSSDRSAGGTNSHVTAWRMTSDADNIYVYMKLVSANINNSRYIYVCFDTDNDGTSGASQGGVAGVEQYVVVYPAVKDSDPVSFVHGADPQSTVNGSSDKTIQVWTVNGTGDDAAYSFVELCIPRSKVSLTSTGTVSVGVSYNWYDTVKHSLVLN